MSHIYIIVDKCIVCFLTQQMCVWGKYNWFVIHRNTQVWKNIQHNIVWLHEEYSEVSLVVRTWMWQNFVADFSRFSLTILIVVSIFKAIVRIQNLCNYWRNFKLFKVFLKIPRLFQVFQVFQSPGNHEYHAVKDNHWITCNLHKIQDRKLG